MFEVRVSYDASRWPDFDDETDRAVGRLPDFSGMGFGLRDQGWVCKSEIEAERVMRALKALGLYPVRTLEEVQ
jgi:hypothetical protein